MRIAALLVILFGAVERTVALLLRAGLFGALEIHNEFTTAPTLAIFGERACPCRPPDSNVQIFDFSMLRSAPLFASGRQQIRVVQVMQVSCQLLRSTALPPHEVYTRAGTSNIGANPDFET
jgi:hypothetical protein